MLVKREMQAEKLLKKCGNWKLKLEAWFLAQEDEGKVTDARMGGFSRWVVVQGMGMYRHGQPST